MWSAFPFASYLICLSVVSKSLREFWINPFSDLFTKIKLFVFLGGKGREYSLPPRTTSNLVPFPLLLRANLFPFPAKLRANLFLFPVELQAMSTTILIQKLFSFNRGVNSKNCLGGKLSFYPLFHPLKYSFRVKFPFKVTKSMECVCIAWRYFWLTTVTISSLVVTVSSYIYPPAILLHPQAVLYGHECCKGKYGPTNLY